MRYSSYPRYKLSGVESLIFSFALQKRAAKVIIVHNHPAGSLQPAIEDRDITDRMYEDNFH